ncbi:MAG: hypothetical protein N2490_01240 [Ignavibacteria bacterium]|nr:hypothetical protein [Ignavibacteria bacterium]
MKKLLLIVLIIFNISQAIAQSGGYAGTFARLGFGARGLSKGNAMVSDLFGEYSGYYNPALACFQENGNVSLGYTFMSLDRKLNFIGFAKKFPLQNIKGGAGISLSWINFGVSNIDGRDNDGNQIGSFSIFENQFYLGTSFLVEENFALGIGFKLYYSKLFDEVSTTSIAFDLGAAYKFSSDLSFGLAIRDLSAKYKWETSKIYGSSYGRTTENKFPILVNFGSSYLLPKNLGIVSLEIEGIFNPNFDDKINGIKIKSKNYYYLKAGGELNINEYIKLRAGCDRIGLNEDDFFGSLKPGIGIGIKRIISKNILLGLDYSFQLEPFSKDAIQNVSINLNFK